MTCRRLLRAVAALTLAGGCCTAVAASGEHARTATANASATSAQSAATQGAATHDAVAVATDGPLSLPTADQRALDAASSASRFERAALVQTAAARTRVVVTIGAKRTTVRTTATTVAELLAELHVQLRPSDSVSAPLSSALANGERIRITRIDTSRATRVVTIAFDVQRVADPTTLRGQSRVVTTGQSGQRREVWRVTSRDGSVVSRVLVTSVVLTKPRAQVVAYGTKPPAPRTPTGRGGYPAYGGLNWYALASCESGNNPHSIDGPFHGLYQFMLDTWRSVGGSGDPANASVQEQTYRAWLLYQRDGRSPWPVCGKHL